MERLCRNLNNYIKAYESYREAVRAGKHTQNDADSTQLNLAFQKYRESFAELKRRITDGIVNSRAQQQLRDELANQPSGENSSPPPSKDPGVPNPSNMSPDSTLPDPTNLPDQSFVKKKRQQLQQSPNATTTASSKLNGLLDTTIKSLQTYEAVKKAFTQTREKEKRTAAELKMLQQETARMREEIQRLTAELEQLKQEIESSIEDIPLKP